jgi:hypothetical protein
LGQFVPFDTPLATQALILFRLCRSPKPTRIAAKFSNDGQCEATRTGLIENTPRVTKTTAGVVAAQNTFIVECTSSAWLSGVEGRDQLRALWHDRRYHGTCQGGDHVIGEIHQSALARIDQTWRGIASSGSIARRSS